MVIVGAKAGHLVVIYVNEAFKQLALFDAEALNLVGFCALAPAYPEHGFARLAEAFSASTSVSIETDWQRRDDAVFPA